MNRSLASLVRSATALVVLASLPCVATAQSPEDDGRPGARWNVAIVIPDGVELLDFAGPGEVFEAASRQATVDGKPWFNVFTVAPSGGEITSQGFVRIVPQYTYENCPEPDIIVIPGGGSRNLRGSEGFMQWVKATVPRTEVTMSVCTGAFVLADAGFLDGLTVTTHHGAIDGLRSLVPDATVVEDRRFVDNGRIVTTAGVSAGIDGALHVVARLLGRDVATGTARYMQYDWRPDPATAAGYVKLNPRLDDAGRARQRAEGLRAKGEWSKAALAYREVVVARPDDAEAWYQLGYCLHADERYDEAIPVHRRAAETRGAPARIRRVALYNLACAYALTGKTELALDTLERTVEAGFTDHAWLVGDADLKSLRDTPRFQRLVASLRDGG